MRFFVCLFVIIAVFVVADVDGRGTVQIEDAAQFQLTSSAERHCLSAESGSMCVGPGETDYQWFFTEQEVIMSTRYLATQVTVQESLAMTAVSTSLSGNTNMNLGEAEWTGNVVDLKDGESFYFMNYLSSGQVPNVYIGNGSIQVPLLTDALLPLDPTLGGTGSQNLDGVMATFQLGSLSMLDGADTALDVLTIVNGGTGLTDIIADPFQHGSLAFEDGVDRFQPLELPRTQGGTGAGEIESAAFQLGLGAYAFEEYILPDFENMPRLPIRKGGFTLPENLGSLSHLDLAIGYDLSLSFDLSSGGTGASSIQSVSTNLQLGSIAERDAPSSYDFFTTIPVDQGGTNTRSNQNTAFNLQLGLIGQHDVISQTDLKDSLNIQNGGTQAKSISPALNNFQLGRLADEDLISLALDYREVRTLELGGLASSNLEQASKNMQLGGLATDEQFELRNYVDQLPPSRGGLTSAGLQLGSLSEADDIDVRLLNRFVLSIADSGLATTQVSTVWSNLQVGSIGFTDIADLEVDFFGSIDISQGGLGTSSLEGFLPSTQSGAVATEEIAFSIVDVLPVHKGGTSSSNVETAALWGLQLGSLATWDDVDTDQLIGSLTRNLGATGVNSVVDLNPLLQLGSLSVEDIGDDYISSLSFSLSQGGLPSQSLSTDFGRFAFEDDAPIEKELRDVVPVSQEGTGVSSIGKVASRYQFGSLAREEDLSSSTLMGSSLFNLNEGGLGGSNIERDVTNLQLGSLAYGDFFVPLDLYESFQISQGGTGDNSLTRVSETFMSGSLSLEDLVTPTLIPAGVIKWTIAQGGTSTEDLERARVNFQYGSIAIEDTSGQFNLGDFVITVSQGGVASTVNGLGPNFQGGSLIWEDIFSPTYWTNSELLPRKNGGLVPVTAPFLGALSTEDWVSGYEQDRAAILDVPLSGTSAIEIESVRNNFQLGYFSTEDFSYLSYLSIKDSNVKNGFLPRAGIEGFSTSYQLGNLAKEDEEDNYLLYGSITRRQGGVGNADSLQVGSVGLADWIDINLFGASIGTSSGGTGFNTIEGALGAVQLGSTAFEDWGYLPHANNVFTRQTGGTSSKNLEGATSTLQLGSVSFDDIGQLERSTMLISPRQGGLYYPSTVEGNWVGDQLGSMSSNDYVDERDLRLVSAFTFLQGGTAADDIELARDNLQLGSIASEDITKYSVLFDPLVISNGGTGEQSINDVPNDFFLGSIAPDDFIDPYLFTTTAGLSAKSGMSYVRHGMISPAMSQGLEGQLGLGRLGVEDWVSLKYDLDLTLKMRQGGLAVSSLSQFGPATQTGSLSQLDIVDSEDLFRGSVFGIGSGGTGAGTLETAGTNFLLGSISREEQWSNTLYSRYSPLLQRNEGGLNAKNIETARNNLLLGSMATQDSVDVTDLPTRTIKQGGTQATTLETADNNLQLGSLAFAESVSTSLLSASFKLPSANGGFNLVLNSPQWQLGSLSVADVVESSIFDYYPTLSIKGGGLEAQNMDVARNNLEIGSLGLDDIIFARDFYSLDEFYPISLGGTQTSQVAGLTSSLQLGSLAQEDMISATEVDDTPPDITVGQTGVTGIEELLTTWYLGSSATADSELPDRLIVRNGGSSATHLEAADLNLQLGSAASEDHIIFSDMGRFVVPIAYGGLAGSNIEISKNQLQLGSSAAEDFFYGTVFFDVTEGGTKATTIDAAKNNFQLGLLSSQDTVASYDFRATFPVKRGGLSGAPSPDLALQAGSLAFEELVEPVYDIRGVLYSLSEGGTGTGYMEAGSVPFFNSGVTKWIGDQEWGAFVPSSEATPANGGSLRLNTNTNDPTVAVEMTSPATHTTSLKLSQSQSDWSSPPAGSAVLSLSATYLGPEQTNWANGNVNYIDFRKKTGASSATMGGFVSTGDSTIVSVGFTSVGADYAEHLQQADSQEKIQPGDLVALFGNGTVSRRYDPSCAFCPEAPVNFLIASSAPTVVGGMPTDADTNSTSVIVAFLGRVPARVVGPVKKGDFLVPSGRMDGSMAAISPALFQKQGHRFSYFVGVAWDDYHPSTFSASPFSASSAASGLVNAGVGLPTQRIFSPILQARRQQQVDDLSLVLQQQEKTLASLSSKIDRLRQLIHQTETLIQ